MLHFFTPQRAVLLSIAICLTLTLSLGVLIRTPHLSSLEGTSVLDPDSARYLRQRSILKKSITNGVRSRTGLKQERMSPVMK